MLNTSCKSRFVEVSELILERLKRVEIKTVRDVLAFFFLLIHLTPFVMALFLLCLTRRGLPVMGLPR